MDRDGFEEAPGASIDTRGLYCPVPILRARDRLRALGEGDVLEILADDPVILEDMPAYCRSHGHHYLGHVAVEDRVLKVRVRKGAAGGS